MNKLSSDEYVPTKALIKARSRNVRMLKGLNDAWEELHTLWIKTHNASNKSTPLPSTLKTAMVIIETAIAAAEGE